MKGFALTVVRTRTRSGLWYVLYGDDASGLWYVLVLALTVVQRAPPPSLVA